MNLDINNQIKKIANAFFVENGKVFFGGKLADINLLSGEKAHENLQLLSEIIYKNCYACNKFEFDAAVNPQLPSLENNKSSFRQKLQSANHSEDALSFGWLTEDSSETGSVLVAKKEFYKIALAGNYLLQTRIQNEAESGNKAILKTNKHFSLPQNHFYFISGNEQHDWWNSGIVRFYWNLQPEGAPILIDSITKYFNRFRIPYQFKCLNDPYSFNRSDSGVIYLANCYFSTGIKLLKEIYDSAEKYLNEDVPMFTLKIAKGFSFAENPSMSNSSFGQIRSQIISLGLIKAWNTNIEQDKVTGSVRQTIVENNFYPDKFYLNANSFYEYDFGSSGF